MDPSHLCLNGVVKSYDGQTNAVDNVTINIERGEFVTFLGPSGSGKTTTLMMIAGFEHPTKGAIKLDGRDLVLSKPYKRNIGMVFQNYAPFPHMTVRQNVVFPLKMRRFSRGEIEARTAKILDLVSLGKFADRYPRELSGGQQQRVALARGLVFNPDVLLLDEPLGALDKNLREQMQVEIKRIHREVGITMIYVTHDQTEAMTMSDRVAVFHSGRLEQVASPLDVYNRPASRFVGEFIGDSNFFEGRLDPLRPGWVDLKGIGPARIADKTDICMTSQRAVCVLIRPERLRLHTASGASESENTFCMTIEAVINFGDSILAIGATNGLRLRMRVAGAQTNLVREGTRITVAWSPEDAHMIVVAP